MDDLFSYGRPRSGRAIIVESGVPIPEDGRPRKRTEWRKPNFPFSEMSVGDSFAVFPQAEQPLIVLQNMCSGAASQYRKTQAPDKRFTTRQMGDRVRVWRTE